VVFSPPFWVSKQKIAGTGLFMNVFIRKISSLFFSCTLTAIMVAAITSLSSASAFAYGVNECPASRFGSNLGCTAGDVSITGIAIAPGSPTKCVGGSTYTVDLDITINFAVPDRWDIGIFLSQDGSDPQTLSAGGGANSCSVGILPNTTPFLDLDSNGGVDTCGDGNGSINGGTGSGVVRMSSVPVACQATALSNGNLFIPFVVTWDNTSTPPGEVCTSIADPYPNTKSKCNAPDGTVEAEVRYGTIETIVLPSISKDDGITTITAGDSSTYTVVITNTTGAALDGVLFQDPAVADLTVNSLSCSASVGASCPISPSISIMQGGGILLPSMDPDSSLTFTIDATVNAASTAGNITNTAYVSFRGETNEDSDTNNVTTKINATKAFSPASITAGDTSVLTVTLENSNLNAATNLAFSDIYPAGLVNTGTPGLSNTCGGTATATAGGSSLDLTGGNLAAGATCAVSVSVTSAASGAYLNSTGAISSDQYAGDAATANLAVGVSSLETSTKTWQDLNGGEADPGDTLRYTITLTETAGVTATGVFVTDLIPATLSGATVTTCPSGATCNIVAGTLTASNVTVPANSSVAIVFDATIPIGLAAATAINNCVDIANPTGIGASTCASTITVSPSQVAITGNKWLYLDSTTSLSRTPPAAPPSAVTVPDGGANTWSLSPALTMPVTISPLVTPLAIIPVNLYLASDAADETRSAQVTVACSGGGMTYSQELVFDGTALNNPYLSTTPGYVLFNNLPFSAEQTCAAGESWELTVENTTPGKNAGDILVYPVSGGNNSFFSIPSLSVINVDSVNSYNAIYPAVTTPVTGAYFAGDTVYVRAVVSDPFGSDDINSATITIKDPSGTSIVTDASIANVVATTPATKTYEYSYVIPAGAAAGSWTTIVTANEGTEGMVSDSGTGAFPVAVTLPSLTFLKLAQVESDPVNGTSGPQSIPGAYVRYSLIVTNSGPGSVDNNMEIIDPVPANTTLFVDDLGDGSPVLFSDPDVDSGYTAPQPFSLSYSQKGSCDTYTYTPVSVGGFDADVCRLRVQMNGTMAGAVAPATPDFSLTFQVRVE
jgi:uncharacterized repeat protein (TIGR01451 family)